MSDHNFDQAIALSGEADNRTNVIHPAYQNMVGPYGGISAATLLNSVLTHPRVQGTPVALTVNYLAPISGEQINIRPREIKTNRSNQHWMIEASCEDKPVLTATLVMATRRDTWKDTELPFPEATHADKLQSLPSDTLNPWAQQYDFRFVHGAMNDAFQGDTPSESLYWISDKPARRLDFLSLCSICDASFPRLWVRHRAFDLAPFGTVSFTVHFHVDREELAALSDGWVLCNARASKFFGSYCDQTAEVWSSNKTLLATTSQVAYYKY